MEQWTLLLMNNAPVQLVCSRLSARLCNAVDRTPALKLHMSLDQFEIILDSRQA
jgi:hypothetical protein